MKSSKSKSIETFQAIIILTIFLYFPHFWWRVFAIYLQKSSKIILDKNKSRVLSYFVLCWKKKKVQSILIGKELNKIKWRHNPKSENYLRKCIKPLILNFQSLWRTSFRFRVVLIWSTLPYTLLEFLQIKSYVIFIKKIRLKTKKRTHNFDFEVVRVFHIQIPNKNTII
jgi:hypothetical protein